MGLKTSGLNKQQFKSQVVSLETFTAWYRCFVAYFSRFNIPPDATNSHCSLETVWLAERRSETR